MYYSSREAAGTLISPIDGSVLYALPLRNISIKESPALGARKYSRSSAMDAPLIRDHATVTFAKTVQSLELIAIIKAWRKGARHYPFAVDLRCVRYRHPHLRLALTNSNGTIEMHTAYDCSLSDRGFGISAPGALAEESITLDALGGLDNPGADHGVPCQPTRLFRSGSASYITSAGAYAVAGDGVARFGLPGPIARRNLFVWSGDPTKSPWDKSDVTITGGLPDAFGGNTATLLTMTTNGGGVIYQPFAVTAGKQMIYSFYAKRGTSTSPKYCAYDTTSGQVGIIVRTSYYSLISDSVFARVVMAFTVPAGCTSLNIYPSSDSGIGTVITCGHQLEVDSGSHLPGAYQATNATGIDSTALSAEYATNAGLVLEGAVNQYLASPDTPATQTVSLGAGTYTLGMDDTGSVALSGGPTGTATAIAPATFTLAGTTSVTFTVTAPVTRFNLQNLPFRSSHIPGASRNADLCAASSPYNEIANSHDLTASTYTKSAGCTVTASGGRSLVTLAATTDNLYQAISSLVTPIASTTRTIAAELMLPSSSAISGSVLLRLLDQAGNQIASTTVNTSTLNTSTPTTVFVTGTPASDDTELRVQTIGNSGTGGILHDNWRMVQGSMPGIEVRTGDTPILRPADDVVDPVWNSNGKIAGSFVLPVGANVAAGTVILGKIGEIVITQLASTITLSRASNGGTRTVSITLNAADGGLHAFEISWGNYTTAGTRAMPLTLTVGAQTATIDAAALYGDTSWTPPERIWLSGGSSFATLKGVKPDFRAIPTGSIAA